MKKGFFGGFLLFSKFGEVLVLNKKHVMDAASNEVMSQAPPSTWHDMRPQIWDL
jgi:hypothetical protein